MSWRTVAVLLVMLSGGTTLAAPAEEFRLRDHCPPSFEKTAAGTCELRSLYQFYDSLGGKGVGGIVGFNGKTASAEQKSAACQSCHASNRHLAFWDAGKHKKSDVACSDCHSLHGAPGAGRARGSAAR